MILDRFSWKCTRWNHSAALFDFGRHKLLIIEAHIYYFWKTKVVLTFLTQGNTCTFERCTFTSCFQYHIEQFIAQLAVKAFTDVYIFDESYLHLITVSQAQYVNMWQLSMNTRAINTTNKFTFGLKIKRCQTDDPSFGTKRFVTS